MTFSASELEELRTKLLDRSVEMDGPIEGSSCWIWTGPDDCCYGYGRVQWKGERWRTHRLSYIAFMGPIPDDLQCLHHCDVPACLNPNHLYLGTPRNNAEDRSVRDRGNRPLGENNPNAYLTELQASEILWLALEGYPSQEIADLYGVGRDTVWSIKVGDSWGHIGPREPPPQPVPQSNFVRRI
jgi:hypothetical protein